jgi:hypothetical protein
MSIEIIKSSSASKKTADKPSKLGVEITSSQVALSPDSISNTIETLHGF